MTTLPNFKLSFSSLDCYHTCPFRFKKLYIEHKWEAASHHLFYGSVFHDLIDNIYLEEKFTTESAYELWPKLLDKEILKKKYSEITKKEFTDCKLRGEKDILVFFNLVRRENLLKPAIEHECAIDGKYRQHIMRAKIDLVTGVRGGIGILDWKTGQPDKKTLMQLALYAALYSRKTKRQIDWICPVYFRTNEVVYQPFDEEIQEEAGKYFSEIYEEFINDTKFLPKINRYCKNCSFKKICGSHPK